MVKERLSDEQLGDEQLSDEQLADREALQAAANPKAYQPGYQPTTAAPDVPDSIPTIELVRPVLAMACAAFVPAWEITGPEQEQLAEVYSAVLDKYFPGGMAMGPELTAVLVTAAVVMPRLGKPRKLEEKPAADADA